MKLTPRLEWMAVPAVALVAVALFYPMLDLLRLTAAHGTFEPYRTAFGDSLYVSVLWLSVRIAAATAVLCLLLGYPVAYLLATTTAGWRVFGFAMVMLPFWTSLLVRTYAWMILLGRNGVINKLLIKSGLIDEPLALIYNTTGVLIGTVHYLVPFMVLPIFAAIRRMDANLVPAAQSLGASGWSVFTRVYLPTTAKGICAGASVVFIIAFSAFVTPALLGGGRIVMIANVIQTQVSQLLNWPLASALAVAVIAIAMAVYGSLHLVSRRIDPH